jgi:hypothetical protein
VKTGVKASAVLAIALVLFFQLRAGLRSDEDRVLGLIAEAAEGWNDASSGDTVAPLAEDFRLYPLNQGKDWLRGILFNIYMHNRDPGTQAFQYRAEVDWENVHLRFVDPEHAQVSGRLRIERTDGHEGWNYDGVFGIEAFRRDGEWKIVAAALQGLDHHRSRTRKKPDQG